MAWLQKDTPQKINMAGCNVTQFLIGDTSSIPGPFSSQRVVSLPEAPLDNSWLELSIIKYFLT